MLNLSRHSPFLVVWALVVLIGNCLALHAQVADVPIPTPRPFQIPEVGKTPSPVSSVRQPFQGPDKPATFSPACLNELARTGAKLALSDRVEDAAKGCSIAEPVVLLSLGNGIGLEPKALLDCPTAARLATFVQMTMQATAIKHFGSGIRSIKHDSAYVCRPRNGTAKLSEHAFGRAVDIGSITLENGLVIPVMAFGKEREDEATFLTAIRLAACGPFSTVLGPGSDSDHALHFHFDMAPRKRSAYCR